LVRIAAAFTGATILLNVATLAWVVGFAAFVVAYGPLLASHRPAWKEARC
jgi:uncharacterized protein involved in response to NO